MVSSFRRILVMTLLMLQIAAPLVHAHVGLREVSDGFHLHEFESLASSHHEASVQLPDYRVDAGMALTIGQAINTQLTDPEWMPAIILPTGLTVPAIDQPVRVIRFNYRTSFRFVNPSQKQNLTRAPPV